ncbi:MAG: ABC transporter ATP-binding protein [Deltaproteobacteria bacterium HGW-Deltaproteobacteria-15]|jgi:peptide/nickel transport system ATP-binding protein|nr:MAG: ABC transporter ATP-binding protein [Deltaproteobacteria bacterium HGW-Deltaproteobacteria-15]
MTLLSVEGLSVCYQTGRGYMNAVEQVSFSLDKGRSLGFVGESGCGKTTLGMALMRLLPSNGRITEGKIWFNGEDLLRKSEEEMRRLRWKEMAMIFQAAMNALNPVHRVQDQIAEAILTHYPETDKRAALDRVAELFRLVGLPEDRMRDYPHQYSGGMKQRAIIAMALSCNPKLIIADEPTTALDVIVQHQILERTKSIQKELGFGIIFISHDISVVAEVCDDIGIMYAGQLVEVGAKEEVFKAPRHPYTIALFSSFPTLTEKRSLMPIPGETPSLIDPPAGCRFCDRCPGAQSTCSLHFPCWVEVSENHRVMCSCCSPASASRGRG